MIHPQDAEYTLYNTLTRFRAIEFRSGRMTLYGQDIGASSAYVAGDDEYEFWYSLDAPGTSRLLSLLRERYGEQESLPRMLRREFGGTRSAMRFRTFCEENGIDYQFTAY